ncbi:F-box protein [Spatholobus suberectus]|nr:F-box protein [Spatholobus suberectus]
MHMADNASSAKHSSPLSNINNLPDDVLGEIFIRLPLRWTAKCKCVCKRWLGLISSPTFPTQFVSRQHALFKAYLAFLSPHQLMLGFFPQDLVLNAQTHKAPLSPDMLIKGNVCGYSNGLFLCCSNRYTTGRGYFVYDPLTKECTHITPSPEADQEEGLYAVGFLSHTEEGNPNRCFWVVIVKSFIRRTYEFEVEVFSKEAGTWREMYVTCANGFAFAPHWMLSCAYGGNLYFMGRTSIFVLDPIFLFSCTVDYPEDADAMNIMSFGYLGCCGGTLRIADIGHNDLRVWELIHPQTWHLVHRTNLAEHLPPEFCANYYKRVAGFHPYDGDTVYLHSYADGVFAANMRTNKFQPIPGYDKSDISPFQLELSPIPSADN